MTRPALIVVCGAPATGKSTLVRRLATDLRLPLLEKDIVKESLAGVVVPVDREASKRVGAASIRLVYDLAYRVLTAGIDVMVEANLNRTLAMRDLTRSGCLSWAWRSLSGAENGWQSRTTRRGRFGTVSRRRALIGTNGRTHDHD